MMERWCSKIEDEELQYRGEPLVVTLPHAECNSCGFDVVSYELMVEGDAIVKEAKRKAHPTSNIV